MLSEKKNLHESKNLPDLLLCEHETLLFIRDRALAIRKLTLNSIPAGGPLQIFCSKMIERFFIQFFYGTYIIMDEKIKQGGHGYLGNFKISSRRNRVETERGLK